MNVSFVFTKSNSLISRIIRWFTNGRVSHVMIMYDNSPWGGQWIAEATVGGVRMVPAEKDMKGGGIVAIYDCKFDAQPALKAMRDHIGDGYFYTGLIFFAWAIFLGRILKRKIRSPFTNTTEEFCSEFAAMVLVKAEELKIVPTLNGLYQIPVENDPEDMLEVMEKNPDQFAKRASW